MTKKKTSRKEHGPKMKMTVSSLTSNNMVKDLGSPFLKPLVINLPIFNLSCKTSLNEFCVFNLILYINVFELLIIDMCGVYMKVCLGAVRVVGYGG